MGGAVFVAASTWPIEASVAHAFVPPHAVED
jgi:hypothetical protein